MRPQVLAKCLARGFCCMLSCSVWWCTRPSTAHVIFMYGPRGYGARDVLELFVAAVGAAGSRRTRRGRMGARELHGAARGRAGGAGGPPGAVFLEIAGR